MKNVTTDENLTQLITEVSKYFPNNYTFNHNAYVAKLAKEYKLSFDWTLFGVTTYFKKENWEEKLDLSVNPFDYGQPQSLTIKERKKLKYIFGSGKNFPISILKCILFAYTAKVITSNEE